MTTLIVIVGGAVLLGLLGMVAGRNAPRPEQRPDPGPRCTAPGPYGEMPCGARATHTVNGEPRCRRHRNTRETYRG